MAENPLTLEQVKAIVRAALTPGTKEYAWLQSRLTPCASTETRSGLPCGEMESHWVHRRKASETRRVHSYKAPQAEDTPSEEDGT